MSRLVEFPLEAGGSVVVEVEEFRAEGDAVVRRGLGSSTRPTEVVSRASETLESAFGRIQPMASAMVMRLRGLVEAPDEIEIEFGVQLSAEIGAIVAHTAGEANFRVRLHWKRELPPAV
jgi:Trypsin-co-occurring domain 1